MVERLLVLKGTETDESCQSGLFVRSVGSQYPGIVSRARKDAPLGSDVVNHPQPR